MESIQIKSENYAVVLNVNLIKVTIKEAAEFKAYFEEAIQETDKDIIVNLSVCEYLDSTFLGMLVKSYKKLKTKNRTIAIIEPINQSSILLTLNSIGKIFPIYSSVQIALDDIENKRLLEKELTESTLEQDESDDNLDVISSENSIRTPSEETADQNQYIEQEEFYSNSAMIDTELEISEEPIVIPDKMKERSWNLMDNEETEFENTLSFTSESEMKLESAGENEQVEDPTEYEESHSNQSDIKWEFGFSS